MEPGKIAYGILAVVVAIVIIASVAIPAVDEASKVPQAELNEYSGLTYDLDDEFSMSYDHTAGTYTIGDATLAKPGSKAPIVGADLLTINLNASGKNVLRYWDSSDEMVDVEMTGNWSLSMSSGIITITFGENTYTRNVTLPAIHLASEGAYLFNDKDAGFVNYNSNRTAECIPWIVTSSSYGFGVGTVANVDMNYGGSMYGVDVAITSNNNGSIAVGEAVMGPGSALERTVSYFIPIEYTIMVDGDGIESTLFSIIPLLLIVSALMIAVKLIGGRN